jgi:alkylated DNA repair dioxygenase AlkB
VDKSVDKPWTGGGSPVDDAPGQPALALGGKAGDAGELLPLPGASLRLWRGWLTPREAATAHRAIEAEVPWATHTVRIYGRELPAPRRCCWMGEPGAVYRYSAVDYRPHPWTPAVHALKSAIEARTGARYNSVLLNLYRDGADSMGLHADDEPELGAEPVIASLSLGAMRDFVFRARIGAGRHVLPLGDGDLLLMAGETQRHWKHELPKRRGVREARINLTFRWIHGA